jgi:hypothetical protein
MELQVLLIRSWVEDVDGIVASLRAAGIEPKLERVDTEPALHAASTRGGFDLVILDPATPGITRAQIEIVLTDRAPLVVLDPDRDVGDDAKRALASRRS